LALDRKRTMYTTIKQILHMATVTETKKRLKLSFTFDVILFYL